MRVRVQEALGRMDQALTLARIDAAQGTTELQVQAVADFDEYYCIGIEHDQIKLAFAASPVTCDERQALALQKVQGLIFGSLSGCLGSRWRHQRAVSGRRLTWPLANSAQGS